jgi:hypothetical protein
MKVIYPPPYLHPDNIYNAIKKSSYEPWEPLKYKIAPIQAWRILPYESFQLDVVVTEEELRALISDRWLIKEDLNSLFFDEDKESLNLVKRDYKFWYHSPGNLIPRYRFYKKINAVDAVSSSVLNPYFIQWYGYLLGWNQFMVIRKWPEAGGEWQVSFAFFLERLPA